MGKGSWETMKMYGKCGKEKLKLSGGPRVKDMRLVKDKREFDMRGKGNKCEENGGMEKEIQQMFQREAMKIRAYKNIGGE